MNKLNKSRRAQVVASLVEGNSLRATARMTGVSRATVEKLLRDLGHVCAMYQRVHGSLRVTPAMAAGVTDRLWSIEDMLGLLD